MATIELRLTAGDAMWYIERAPREHEAPCKGNTHYGSGCPNCKGTGIRTIIRYDGPYVAKLEQAAAEELSEAAEALRDRKAAAFDRLAANQRDIHYHPHIGKWTTWPQHGAGKSDVEATDLLSLAESLPEEG